MRKNVQGTGHLMNFSAKISAHGVRRSSSPVRLGSKPGTYSESHVDIQPKVLAQLKYFKVVMIYVLQCV